MPVITLDKDRFSHFIDRPITVEEMAKWLPWLGASIEETGPDFVKIEFNPNRLDFSSYTGVARAFCGLMGWKTGLPEYVVKRGSIVINVDEAVSDVRPYILGAAIYNIKIDADSIAELMEMQEDLHWGIGRDRRKASIGVHNLDPVEAPFTYTARDPETSRFIPLGRTTEMNLKEILEAHDKGAAYRHLVDWAPKYPLLVDGKGRVLSMPPIINGELTRVEPTTRNLFIDVTGPDLNAVAKSMNILVTALADMGGSVESVQVKYPTRTITSPDLKAEQMKLRIRYANRLLGLKLSETQIMQALSKCRLSATRLGRGVLNVSIPPYRTDILHEVDLVEEVAIGYGYYQLKPTRSAALTRSKQHRIQQLANHVRQVMIGLGFTEVMNFILTNEANEYVKMRKRVGRVVRLANPVSSEYCIAREDLLPSLMRNLADNKHETYPQRIFEVSDIIDVDKRTETRSKRKLHVAAVSIHSKANFTEIKSYAEALMTNLDLQKREIIAVKHASFLDGRTAGIQADGSMIGVLGELHPEVLNNFELENPAGAFEINLEKAI